MTEHVQINDVQPRIHYVADGVQSAFPFPFAIFRDTDLEVWLGETRQVAGYTVSGAGISTGGTIILAAAPPQGTGITLRRRLALARTTDYQADGVIRAKTLNDELDFQVAAVQQVAEELGRAVKRSPTSASTANLTLPEPVAGRAFKWGGDGMSIVNSDDDVDAIAAGAAAAAAAATAQAATATVRAAEAGASADAAGASAASSIALAATAAAHRDGARLWANAAEDVPVDDGAHPPGYSAFHWSKKAEAAAGGGVVKVSAADTAAGYLGAVLTVDAGLAKTVTNPGADEGLALSLAPGGLSHASPTAADHLVIADASDGGSPKKATVAEVLALVNSVPAGAVAMFAGAAAPAGWLFCSGSAVSRTTYSALFAVIGTAFGAGDGSTTFNLPDLRGRAAIGTGQGSGLTNRALAQMVGTETHALTVAEMPSHNHYYQTPTASGDNGGNVRAGDGVGNWGTGTTSTGGGQAHNNMPPSLALNFIIKT